MGHGLQSMGKTKTFWMYMGVEPKIGGKPPKWMVKIMENLIKMDDLGIPLFLETPIYIQELVAKREGFMHLPELPSYEEGFRKRRHWSLPFKHQQCSKSL